MPVTTAGSTIIVMADDDDDDRMLLKDATDECGLPTKMVFVIDGVDLMDYLHKKGKYSREPSPHLILLDLNMPKKDGRETLKEIKADPALCHIPVVVLTTSTSHSDILTSYQLGASSYIAKPNSFEDLVDVMRTLQKYWITTVIVPTL